MGFVFISTSYLRHPKLAGIGHAAKLLHLASILWTAEHLTDGYLPPNALDQLVFDLRLARNKRSILCRSLIDHGLWDELPVGWRVHDFEQWNRSSTREVVEANRAAAAERQRRHRARESGDVTP